MALTVEGARHRLQALKDISTSLGGSMSALRNYEREWGNEGFIHSITELVSSASAAVETSYSILNDFISEALPLHKKKTIEVPEVPAVRFNDLVEQAFRAEVRER